MFCPMTGAVQHVERGEERRRAVALVVVGHGARPRPFFSGRPGWVRSSAWICDFSSTDSTTAWAGGCDVEADDVVQLLGEGADRSTA